MKIFILFALASVSVCNDYGGSYQPPCRPGYSSQGLGEFGIWEIGQRGSLSSQQGGGQFSGHGNGQFLGQDNGQFSGHGNGQFLGQSNGQFSGQGNGPYSGQGNGHFSGQSNGQFSGQGNGHFSGQSNGQFLGQDNGQFSGHGNGQFLGQDHGQFSGHGNGQFSGHGNGQFSGQDNGQFSGQSNGHFSGQSNGHLSGQVGGQSSGHVGGQFSGQDNGQSSGQVGGQSSGQEGGQSSGQVGEQSSGQVGGQSSGQGGTWSTWSSWSASSSSSFRCDKYKNDLANDDKCMKHALENAPGLMKAAQQLLCKHKNHKEDKTDEYFGQLNKELGILEACAGCFAGRPFGLQKPLGQVGAGAGNLTGNVLKAVENLGQTVGLSEPILNLACSLLGPTLAADCAQQLISKDVPELLTNLKNTFCQKDTDLDVIEIVGILNDAGCLADHLLGTKDALENFTEETGKALAPGVQNIVHDLKENPLLGELIVDLACTLLEPVNELVNGGGGNGGLLGGIIGGGGGGGSGGILGGILGGRGR